jgi:F-type H+-transporting ATPase subunit gamma
VENKVSKQIQIKQKIKSIQTTKKITNALRQVSMSMYSKLEHNSAAVRNYTEHLKTLFTELVCYDQTWQNPLLFPKSSIPNPLIVIISTSKGLCGSLNSNLFKFVEKEIEKEKYQNFKFITIGHKANIYIKDRGYGEVISNYNDFSSSNYISIARDIMTKFVDTPTPFTSITFLYNNSKSFFAQRPSRFQLVPLQIDSDRKNRNVYKELIWEQNTNDTLDYLSVRYVKGQILFMLFQALISEHSARFVAMDSSTTNAEKFIETVTLQYNKMRQAEITKEVSGLCAGFMDKNS